MEYLDPDKLWKIMKKKDVSPSALIDNLGVEARTIGRWLVGDSSPRPGLMRALAKALGVPESSITETPE